MVLKKVSIDIVFSDENLAFENFSPLTNFLFHNNEELIENYYEFARYLNPKFRVDNPKLSVTSAATFEERIRFNHYSKIFYVINFFIDSLITKLKTNNEFLSLTLYNCNRMLESDVLLINRLIERIQESSTNIQLSFHESNPKLENNEFINKNKIELSERLEGRRFWSHEDPVLLFQRAMNLSLFEDAIKIGVEIFDNLQDLNEKCKIADHIGIAYILYEKQEEGEHYYKYVLEQECDINIKISVLYKLCMLYLRHYDSSRRDPIKAENYLLLAKNYIEMNEEYLGKNFVFHKVFNRNGYSLILFNKGEIDTAHQYCIDGHEKILETYGPVKHVLHRSVLIYNSTLTSIALKNYKQAEIQFDYLFDMDPFDPNYWLKRAEMYKEMGKLDLSLEDYTQAIHLNPFSEGLYCARGILYEEMLEEQKAKEDYSKALRLNPKHNDSLLNYGVLLLNEKDLDNALVVFNKITKEDSLSYANALNNIGLVYLEMNELESAQSYFDEAIKQNPEFSVPLANNALVFFEREEYEKALHCINEAIKIEEKTDYLYNKSFLLNRLGEYFDAQNELNIVLDKDPLHLEASKLREEIEGKLAPLK